MKPIYIESIVREYLHDPNIAGAIFINGEWGSGKTYYLKNKLFKLIQQYKCREGEDSEKEPDESNPDHTFRPIYISLNGLVDTKAIDSQIISGLLKMDERSKLVKLLFKAGKIAAYGASKVNIWNSKGVMEAIKAGVDIVDLLEPLLKKTVLCFDDLERIGGKLTIDEILGYINIKFIEHNDIRTIIIGDERHITYPLGKEAIKEKVFWRELAFDLGVDDIYFILKERFAPQGLSDFLEEEKEFIILVLSKLKIRNLRTILFAFDIFTKVNSLFKKEEIVVIGKELLIFVISICKEFRENRLSMVNYEEKETLRKYNPDFIESAMFFQGHNVEMQLTLEQIFFKESIIAFDYRYKFISPVYKYIVTGYFEEDKIREAVIASMEKPNKEDEIVKIISYKTLSDTEFISVREKAVKMISNGEISVYRYPFYWDLFESFVKDKLISLDLDAIKSMFNEGMQKATDNNTSYKEDFTRSVDAYDPKTEHGKLLLGDVMEYHKRMQMKRKQEKAESLYKLLSQKEMEIRDTREIALRFDPIFNFLSLDKLIELIIKSENKNISKFVSFIQDKYQDMGGNTKLLLPDKEHIISLKQRLEEIDQSQSAVTPIKKLWLNELICVLNKIVSAFEHYELRTAKVNVN